MLTVPVWFRLPVHGLPGMAAQVIKTHLDSLNISADRAVWGKALGNLAHYRADVTPTEHVWERKTAE